MDIDRMKQLIAQREAIDAELVTIVTKNGASKNRKAASCSVCDSPDHTARNCPTKGADGNK